MAGPHALALALHIFDSFSLKWILRSLFGLCLAKKKNWQKCVALIATVGCPICADDKFWCMYAYIFTAMIHMQNSGNDNTKDYSNREHE